MAMFALVHGAWHGAWCWERVTPELERRGHHAIAVDLPCDETEAGCVEYARVVVDALEGHGDDVVVVGHSLGGLTIPLVAASRPVRMLVFLCGLIPRPGKSFVDQLQDGEDVFEEGFADATLRDELERSYWPRGTAAQGMYPECPPEVAEWASERLRPQARRPNVEQSDLAEWPAATCAYVLGRRDSAIKPEWSRRVARERLGVEAIELDAGHSPFATQPEELATVLDRLAP
jgi:pimeloyl-ACP methyl ester carboxylesterase